MSSEQQQVLQIWNSGCSWSSKTGPQTVFQTRKLQFWHYLSRYTFWKVCFSTAGNKHCRGASFPLVPSSYEKLFQSTLLKDSQQGFHLETPWAIWSPDLEDLPVFVAHESSFFRKNGFQLPNSILFMKNDKLFEHRLNFLNGCRLTEPIWFQLWEMRPLTSIMIISD